MFSQFARKVIFSEIKHIYNTLYTVYTRFSHCIRDFRECSHNSLVGKRDFITFVFLWPTTISPRNASLGSLQRNMVKAYSVVIFHYR